MDNTRDERWRAKQAKKWAAVDDQAKGWVDRHMIAFRCQMSPKTVHRKVIAGVFPPYEHSPGPRLNFWNYATAKDIIDGKPILKPQEQAQEHDDYDDDYADE